MSFKIGDKVTYCGNNKYLRLRFYQECEGQEVNVGEVVDILKSDYFGGPIIKVKFENGYLAGREEDFRLYEEPKVKKETENPYQYVFEATQRIENKATVLFSGKEKGGTSFTVDFNAGIGRTPEEKFLGAILAAIEKLNPGLISDFVYSKEEEEEEECGCEDECNCDENCDCECENCKCSLEPYSGKIYCVKSGYDYITEGKIYEVKEGKIEADDGWVIRFSPEKGCTGVLSTFKEFSEVIRGEWIEVKEAEEIISPSNYEADIICVYSGPIENFTRGKIYRVENGYLYDDKKNKISWYGVPFTDINGINSYCASIFKEIKN